MCLSSPTQDNRPGRYGGYGYQQGGYPPTYNQQQYGVYGPQAGYPQAGYPQVQYGGGGTQSNTPHHATFHARSKSEKRLKLRGLIRCL